MIKWEGQKVQRFGLVNALYSALRSSFLKTWHCKGDEGRCTTMGWTCSSYQREEMQPPVWSTSLVSTQWVTQHSTHT